MIKITIELYPHGRIEGKRRLGYAIIANDGSGTKSRGNYNIKLFKEDDNKPWKTCEIKGFKRLLFNAWDLLYGVLKKAIGSRYGRAF